MQNYMPLPLQPASLFYPQFPQLNMSIYSRLSILKRRERRKERRTLIVLPKYPKVKFLVCANLLTINVVLVLIIVNSQSHIHWTWTTGFNIVMLLTQATTDLLNKDFLFHTNAVSTLNMQGILIVLILCPQIIDDLFMQTATGAST